MEWKYICLTLLCSLCYSDSRKIDLPGRSDYKFFKGTIQQIIPSWQQRRCSCDGVILSDWKLLRPIRRAKLQTKKDGSPGPDNDMDTNVCIENKCERLNS